MPRKFRLALAMLACRARFGGITSLSEQDRAVRGGVLHADDDELLREAGHAAQPPALVDAAIAAYMFRTIDAERAQLTFDSAAPDGEPAVRCGGGARLVTFETGTLTIELEIIPRNGTVHLLGQILPPAVVQIDVRQVDLVSTGSTDGLGRFALALPCPGPFQLSLPYAGQRGGAAVTEWISV